MPRNPPPSRVIANFCPALHYGARGASPGHAETRTYYAVHSYDEGKKEERMNHPEGWSAPAHHVSFQFDREVKSFADVKKTWNGPGRPSSGSPLSPGRSR